MVQTVLTCAVVAVALAALWVARSALMLIYVSALIAMGFAPAVRLSALDKFFPVLWLGFWMNAITGTILLAADAVNKMSNPDFYVKMVFIALAIVNLRMLKKQVFQDPLIDKVPVLSQMLSDHKPIVYLALAMVPISYYVLFRTRFGLRLRAVGENPEAADTAGVSVSAVRYSGVLLSGLLAGVGGAYLSIGQNSLFTRNMTAGRGFIALAALIFGKWHPVGAFLACLLFGLADAISIRMQGVVQIPVQVIQIIPYVLTLVVLAGFIGRATPPRAIGIPYVKEK